MNIPWWGYVIGAGLAHLGKLANGREAALACNA